MARSSAVGFSIGTKGYIGTGAATSSTNNFNDFWEWDQATNTWTQKATLPLIPGYSSRSCAVGFSIGSKGYIGTGAEDNSLGSNFLNDFWEWNQATNTWSQKANFPGNPRAYAVGFSIGNKGYIGTGGTGGTNVIVYNDFWEWDQATDTWSQKPNFGGVARTHAVGFSIGAKGYIGTGQTGGGAPQPMRDFWEWDQSTNIWTQKANFGGVARTNAVGFSIGSYGFLGTGNPALPNNPSSKDWWKYEPCSNTWTRVADFGGGNREGTVGFSIGCKGYVGTGDSLYTDIRNDFREYDPALASILATVSVSSNPLCWGKSATLTAGSGCGIIRYSWSTGATTNSIIVAPTATTTYSVFVVTTCDSSTGTVTVNVDPMITHSFSSVTDINCFGNNNGSATINVSGGTPPFAYSWSSNPVQTTPTATELVAGTYTVTVTEASYGCTFADTITITSPPLLIHSFSNVTNINCFGNNNGSASVNVAGGTPSYTYSWSSIPVQTAPTATGLSPGTYSVTVTDSHSCSFTDTITITSPPLLTHSLSNVTNVDCFGNNNGSASVNVAGGTPSYTYSWSSIPVQTAPIATGLVAGMYSITVTDSHSCSFTDTISITSPALLTHSLSPVINVDCFGNNNGAATVNVAGGIPSYTYSWSCIPVQTTPTITGLYAGVYSVTVTDSHGCSLSDTVIIKSPTGLTVFSPVVSNVLCFGGNTGSATVTASGGTPGYTYSWNPTLQTTSIAVGLTAGVYTITITDNNGCIIKTLVPVTQPPVLLTSISADTSICPGASVTDNVIASGGTPGYTYLWMNTGATTTSILVSPPATTTYTADVTDANGCLAQLITTITVVSNPAASVSYTPDFCGTGYVLFIDNSTNATVWNWNFGDGDTSSAQSPVHIYSASGSYSVTLSMIGSLGCKTNNQLMVDVPPFSQIYIPNAFSPNDDGRDDIYYVFGKCITEMTFTIYDRWGEKVFETTDPAVGWDGRYKGQMENVGVYMYSFNGTLTTGKKINQKGNITLMR